MLILLNVIYIIEDIPYLKQRYKWMFSIDIVFPRSVDQNINTNMCRGGYPPNADKKGDNLW